MAFKATRNMPFKHPSNIVYWEAFQVIRHATVYFVAVILKVLLVNLFAALNFAKNVGKIKKR